jgi:DNA-binding transcriptional MerR regulator
LLEGTNDKHRKKLYSDAAYYDLTQAYYKLGVYDSTIFYGTKITSNPDACFYLFKSYNAIGDHENAMVYAEKYMNKMQKVDNTQLAVDEVKEEYDLQMQQQQLESEHHVKRLRLYLLIAILVIALLVLWFFVSRYRKNKEIEVLEIKNSQRQTLTQSVATIYKSKRDDRLQQIIKQFNNVYPEALKELSATCPELNDTEQKIIVLSFLGFRIKEEADLLGLSENTVRQYRSNANKKAGSDPISDII